MTSDPDRPAAARVVVPCHDLAAEQAFFVERLGFRLDRISPADDPRLAVVGGHGLQLELTRSQRASDVRLKLEVGAVDGLDDGAALSSPGGTRIEVVAPVRTDGPLPSVPDPHQELIVRRASDAAAWGTGRAGMQYRDLIPGRMGGAVIASHIRIPDGGPVPDHVHFHAVRLQLIVCLRGWVRVVYEDQGPPFELRAGDCVLQPPRIRHRVLESSAGLEVLELACPAEHDTFLDHRLELPNTTLAPERDFAGQRFVRHVAAEATWREEPHRHAATRDLGIGSATDGLAQVQVHKPEGDLPARWSLHHTGRLRFGYVLAGTLALEGLGDDAITLDADDAFVIPPGIELATTTGDRGLRLLEVFVPDSL